MSDDFIAKHFSQIGHLCAATQRVASLRLRYCTSQTIRCTKILELGATVLHSYLKHLWAIREMQKNFINMSQQRKVPYGPNTVNGCTGGSLSAVWSFSLPSCESTVSMIEAHNPRFQVTLCFRLPEKTDFRACSGKCVSCEKGLGGYCRLCNLLVTLSYWLGKL